MTSIGQAAAAASIIVGMLSVPAATHTAKSTASPVLNSSLSGDSVSREVVQRSDSDSFYASIETSFSDFTSRVRQSSANASLVSPSARLTVERSPQLTRWKLTSPSGDMVVERSSNRVLRRFETPYGTLVKERSGSEYDETFRGESRKKVEKIADRLQSIMKQRRARMRQKASSLAPETGSKEQNVDVVANKSTASGFGDNSREHVVIVNRGPSVDLEGWKIGNNNPSFYEFGDVTLESGERLKVFSGDPGAESAVTGTGLSWEDGGDTAVLKNARGKKEAASSY